MKQDWLQRERMLFGDEKVDRLQTKKVLLFGVGGVGGYTLEALVRAGVGEVTVVDNDFFSESNLNRQLLATRESVGRSKVAVAAERAKMISEQVKVKALDLFADENNIPSLLREEKPDYVIDAIDTVSAKLSIIREAKKLNIPVISSMGTGNKLDPTRFKITDIAKTHTCPLAKVMRIKLREEGILHADVLFSDEEPSGTTEKDPESGRHIPGSVSYIPAIAGLMLAGYVINKL